MNVGGANDHCMSLIDGTVQNGMPQTSLRTIREYTTLPVYFKHIVMICPGKTSKQVHLSHLMFMFATNILGSKEILM